MNDTLEVKIRESRGTRAARRERETGWVPAILFGHKRENVALLAPASDVASAVQHAGRIIQLRGAVTDSVLISDVQWDAYGLAVIHVDLTRVDAAEKVTVSVPIVQKGEAPGVRSGGTLNTIVHELEIECRADSAPDSLVLPLEGLDLNGSLTADRVQLPEGVQLTCPGDTVIVQCNEQAEADESGGVPSSAEPEVIGRKADDEPAGDA